MKPNCIFCKIIKGELPCHKIWEDEKHLAFLSIFPNTPGFSVVVTKEHYPSYVFDLEDKVLSNLVLAARKVAKLIESDVPGAIAIPMEEDWKTKQIKELK